jgi:hypothetical protein
MNCQKYAVRPSGHVVLTPPALPLMLRKAAAENHGEQYVLEHLGQIRKSWDTLQVDNTASE